MRQNNFEEFAYDQIQSVDKEKLVRDSEQHLRTKFLVVDDQDALIWQQITDVPKVPKLVAIGCALLNLIIPGLGTMVMACKHENYVSKAQTMIGCT